MDLYIATHFGEPEEVFASEINGSSESPVVVFNFEPGESAEEGLRAASMSLVGVAVEDMTDALEAVRAIALVFEEHLNSNAGAVESGTVYHFSGEDGDEGEDDE